MSKGWEARQAERDADGVDGTEAPRAQGRARRGAAAAARALSTNHVQWFQSQRYVQY